MPLEHHYLIGRRLHPMHIEQAGSLMPNPYVVSLDQQELRVKEYRRVGSNAIQTRRMNRPREGHRRVYAPRREEVVAVLARGRDAARDLLRLQPGGLRSQRAVAAGVRHPADDPCRGRSHPGARGESRGVDRRGGSGDPGVLRLPGRTDGRRRRPPRRDAPGLQGDGRGAVRGGSGEGGVRDRDVVARHQHARAHRGDRGPVEVPGRAARDPDPGRVHAADRSRRDGAVSTRWVTRSWSTSGRCRSNASPASRRPGRTTSTRRSARRTTWRSTWCATTTASRRTGSSTRRSRSSWRTAASCRWNGNARTTKSRSTATAPTSPASWATSTSTGGMLLEAKRLRDDDRRGRERERIESIRTASRRPATRRGDPPPEGASSRTRGGPVLAGRQADRALGGPFVRPAVGQGLRRSAGGADPHRAAAIGELPERSLPARRRLQAGVVARQATARASPLRPTRRSNARRWSWRPCAAEHPCASCPELHDARAVGHAGRRAGGADEGCGPPDPDPHRDAGAPVRPRARRARRRWVTSRDGRSHRRVARSPGSTVRGTCWSGSRSRRPCSTTSRPGGRLPVEHGGLRVPRTRAVAGGAADRPRRRSATSCWNVRTGGSGGSKRSIRSS